MVGAGDLNPRPLPCQLVLPGEVLWNQEAKNVLEKFALHALHPLLQLHVLHLLCAELCADFVARLCVDSTDFAARPRPILFAACPFIYRDDSPRLREFKKRDGDDLANSTKPKIRNVMSVLFNHAIRYECLGHRLALRVLLRFLQGTQWLSAVGPIRHSFRVGNNGASPLQDVLDANGKLATTPSRMVWQ